MQIASFSLGRAAERLAGAKRKRQSPDEDELAEIREQEELAKKVQVIDNCGHLPHPAIKMAR